MSVSHFVVKCFNNEKIFVGGGASSLTPRHARTQVPKCETKKNLYKRLATETCMLKLPQENQVESTDSLGGHAVCSGGLGHVFFLD